MTGQAVFAPVSARGWLLLGLPFAALLLHAFYYYPFFIDDAFISLRYSQRLIEGHGLNWNDGERVEGYSNLSWTLLCAGLGALGFDLVASARITCLLATLAAMCAIVYYHHRRGAGNPYLLLVPNLTFAFCAPVAIWSIGGLEGTLIMALLAWAFVLALELLEAPDRKTAVHIGALLGFVCLTRPEGPVFAALISGTLLLLSTVPRRKLLRDLLTICVVPFLFFAGQVAFRLAYYGDWLPNSYYAKVALTGSRLVIGLNYTVSSLALFLPPLLVVLLNADKLGRRSPYPRQRRTVLFCILIILPWLALVTLAGGDMEPGYRHILPVVPLFVLMVRECCVIFYDSGPAYKTHIFFSCMLAGFLYLQSGFTENARALEEDWEWEVRELALWMRGHYDGKQPLVAVNNAGVIPYYTGFPSIDMFGINDGYLTRHKDANFGHGLLGHELFSTDYVLRRKPDIIVFYTGTREPAYGEDIAENPEFMRHYAPKDIELPSYTATIWLRKGSKLD